MVLGRATPLPEEVAFLHLGDMCKLPCWIGITPGKTTIEEARVIVTSVYGKSVNFDKTNALMMATAANGTQLTIGFNKYFYDYPAPYDSNWIIKVIFFSISPPSKIPFGYVAGVLGEPAYIYPIYGSDKLIIGKEWFQFESPALLSMNQINIINMSNFRPIYSFSFSEKALDYASINAKYRWNGAGTYQFVYHESFRSLTEPD